MGTAGRATIAPGWALGAAAVTATKGGQQQQHQVHTSSQRSRATPHTHLGLGPRLQHQAGRHPNTQTPKRTQWSTQVLCTRT